MNEISLKLESKYNKGTLTAPNQEPSLKKSSENIDCAMLNAALAKRWAASWLASKRPIQIQLAATCLPSVSESFVGVSHAMHFESFLIRIPHATGNTNLVPFPSTQPTFYKPVTSINTNLVGFCFLWAGPSMNICLSPKKKHNFFHANYIRNFLQDLRGILHN